MVRTRQEDGGGDSMADRGVRAQAWRYRRPARCITFDAPDPKNRQGWASGFGLRITAGGARSFILNYRVRCNRPGEARHHRRVGRVVRRSGSRPRPTVSSSGLREAKTRWRTAVRASAPTMARVHVILRSRTMSAASARHTIRQYTRIVASSAEALGRKQVAAIEHADAAKLHHEISKTRAGHGEPDRCGVEEDVERWR